MKEYKDIYVPENYYESEFDIVEDWTEVFGDMSHRELYLLYEDMEIIVATDQVEQKEFEAFRIDAVNHLGYELSDDEAMGYYVATVSSMIRWAASRLSRIQEVSSIPKNIKLSLN